MSTQSNSIEYASFAEDPLPENFPLALIEASTKVRAHISAMEAIATPATIERRDILLVRARSITAVTGEDDVKLATEVAGLLKGLRNDVEKARKRLKDPVLDIGRAIDGVATSTVADSNKECIRIENLLGNYAAELERKRQEKIRQQQEEARRQQEEAERIARETKAAAEAAAAQAQAIAANSTDMTEALNAEAEAEEAQVRAEAAQAVAATPIYIKPIPEAPKVSGAAVAKDWDYSITNIAELYAAHPECVELRERKSVIKAVIQAAAQHAAGNAFMIPGLRISPKVNVTTRAR